MPIFHFLRFLALFVIYLLTSLVSADEILEKILTMKPEDMTPRHIEGFTDYDGNWSVDNNGIITGNGSGKLVYNSEAFKNLVQGEVSVEMFFVEADKKTYRNAGILLKIRTAHAVRDSYAFTKASYNKLCKVFERDRSDLPLDKRSRSQYAGTGDFRGY